jgi:LmbE family N-acetylglucosaminyl deacetylase
MIVLSPHLDDGVLSLGAAIAGVAAQGGDVTVLTVFANDPDAGGGASAWDRACGFTSAAEAARARRAEDTAACALLGVRTEWLPFPGNDYRAGDPPASVWADVERRIGDADVVLAPGWPLRHPDHAWLAERVIVAPPGGRLGLYVEQPYAADALLRHARRRPTRVTAARAPRPAFAPWQALRPGRRSRRAKQRAVGAYSSQIGALGPMPRRRIAAYETLMRGEAIAWIG